MFTSISLCIKKLLAFLLLKKFNIKMQLQPGGFLNTYSPPWDFEFFLALVQKTTLTSRNQFRGQKKHEKNRKKIILECVFIAFFRWK